MKKMVIKPFKIQPKCPDNFYLDTWNKLKIALECIYNKQTSLISKEELYHMVEDLCIQKLNSKLYELLTNELSIHIILKVKLLHEKIINHTTIIDINHYLVFVDEIWKDHIEQLHTIRNIFIYLDRSYVLSNPNIKAIWDLGIVIYI